jgi:hypothetical protein
MFPKLFCSRTPSGFESNHRSSHSCSHMVRLPSLNCSYQGTPCDLFSAVEVVNTDVSSSSVFWIWYVKRLLKQLDTKIFYPSHLILGICLNVCLSLQKVRIGFFYIWGESVFPTVYPPIPGFLVFSFHGTSELRKQQMAELLSMNYDRALLDHSCNHTLLQIACKGHRWPVKKPYMHWDQKGTNPLTILFYYSTDHQYCTNFSSCYLYVNDSTPVFMCKNN